MLKELFEYRFVTALSFPLAHELHLLTGMLIGDLGNPSKDTPGSGQFAGNVHLTLERGEEREEWYLSAFTHDLAGADLPAVALLRAQLRLVLTALTDELTEIEASPALPPTAPLPDRESLVRLGDAMAKAGRYDHAVMHYTCALALAPDDWSLRGKRGVCLHRLGRFDDALIDYTHAIQFAPDQARLWSIRASVYTELGRDLDALADLDQAHALEPANPAYRLRAGLLYYRRGTFSAAGSAFSFALGLCPEDADLYFYRGCAEAKIGHVEQAVDDFAQAERLAAKLREIQLSGVLVNLVEALVRSARPRALEMANDAVTKVLAMGMANPTPDLLYLWRADIRQRLCDYAASVADCDQALALSPADPRIYNVKGIALGGMDHLGDALAAFSQAAHLAPNSLGYVHNRAITLGRMGRHEAALAEYTRALLLDPSAARLYSERGEMQAALGHEARAEADYRLALKLAPGDLPTLLRLGALLSNRGAMAEAIEYLERVIERDAGDLRRSAQTVRARLPSQRLPTPAAAPIFLAPYGVADSLGLPLHEIPAGVLAHAA